MDHIGFTTRAAYASMFSMAIWSTQQRFINDTDTYIILRVDAALALRFSAGVTPTDGGTIHKNLINILSPLRLL